MKKIKNRERSIQKKFFVNEKENERIKLMMKKTGINNFSTFARRACCNKEIFTLDFSEYKNIISEISSTKSELKRIGNNINQIAKHLNENKNNQTKEWMSDYQKQLENLEDKIQKVVHYISEGQKNDSDLYAETIERNGTVHNLTVLTYFQHADEQ